MKYFMDVSNRKTLLLLDEFGTGSDPELGGALAEVFFEHLYNKKCFVVFTTHYANIKLKASRLRNSVNASMLFDRESLAPMFELSVGQPGSSFTFEVAQINGIDGELIESAKGLLDKKRVQLDKLIAELQKEKSDIQKLNDTSSSEAKKAVEQQAYYEDLQHHLSEKIRKQEQLIEQNNKHIIHGKKLGQFIDKMKGTKIPKPLLAELSKYLVMEKTKMLETKKKAKLKKAVNQPAKIKKVAKKPVPKKIKPIEMGGKAKLIGGTEVGEVVEIDGKNVTVLFGAFPLKTVINKLEGV
jgi:DNA mismatch repair protein MutS2